MIGAPDRARESHARARPGCRRRPAVRDGARADGLLGTNADIYRDIVPAIVAAAPRALLLVVTDPPDPLADVSRRIAGHDRVLSSGTLLDSMRFRFHLGRKLGVDPKWVEAQVIGEHGTSQVYLWSTARIVEMIGRDEGAVVPIGSYPEAYGVTLSLPSRLGRDGLAKVLMPTLTEEEARALDESAATLRRALRSIEFAT